METSVNTFWELHVCYAILFKCHFQIECYYAFSFLLWQLLTKFSSTCSRFFNTTVKMNTYKILHRTLRKSYFVLCSSRWQWEHSSSLIGKNNKNGNSKMRLVKKWNKTKCFFCLIPLWYFFPATSRESSHLTY